MSDIVRKLSNSVTIRGVSPRWGRAAAGTALLAVSSSLGCSSDVGSDREDVGVRADASKCGTTLDFQDVELYDGTLGVSQAFVAERQQPVGIHIADGVTESCSGTLIARDLFLSAGHCEITTNDEVWFNHQRDSTGRRRTPVIHRVTQVLVSKDTVSGDPEQQQNAFDYAVVRLEGAPAATFGYGRIADEEARAVSVQSPTLAVIGHPGIDNSFNFKVISTGPYAPASAVMGPNWFGVQADMLPGSSGSGILRRDGRLMGLFTTSGCAASDPVSGANNAMRITRVIDDAQIMQQVASMQGVHFANLNGTGGADAVVVNFSNVVARMSNGSSFGGTSNWTTNPYFGQRGTFFADVTGDGRADAIGVNSSAIIVRRSNGTGFNGNEAWTGTGFFGNVQTAFADVTGDGRADAIGVYTDRIWVRRANSVGTDFLSAASWTTAPFFGSLITTFADVTGDGRADVIAINDNLVSVRRSTGTSFSAVENWTSNRFFGAFGTFVADVTGDGRADLIGVNDGIITIRRSNGSSFGANENWLLTSHAGSYGTAFADVTGDGRADAIAVTATGINVRPSTGSSFGASASWVGTRFVGAM